MDFLKNKRRQTQLIAAGWDMVVIDEAHHITDEEKTYAFIKTLAQTTFGLMLLTATPEQMGVKNHFRHLQLLDPERYFDFSTYLDETDQYKKTLSEIGSEGRNFQFVHHLFLFDLPQNPELLEQRIGRIDRLGQKNTIQIHVPFIRGSVYEILARWYMDGLNLFRKNINGVHLIYQQFKHLLQDLFRQSKESMAIEAPLLEKLISETAAYCIKVDNTLTQGKNILLEMNSFKPKMANQLIDRVTQAEHNEEIDRLLIRVLDHYGIETDFIDKTLFKLHSSEMTDEKFPALTRLSDTMTFNRETAIARDDIDFLSWDHPFVQQTFDFFITTSTGSCATALLKEQGHPEILLETVFILECVAPARLNMERFLMPEPIRIVVDHDKKDITGASAFTALSKKLVLDQSTWFRDLDQVRQDLIPSMIEKSMAIAGEHSEQMIQKGKNHIKEVLGQEIARLTELKKINPNIKKKEITLAHTRMTSLLDHLSSARLRMDALRLIRVE